MSKICQRITDIIYERALTDHLKDGGDDDGQESDPEEDEQGRAQADGRLHAQRPTGKGDVATWWTVTLQLIFTVTVPKKLYRFTIIIIEISSTTKYNFKIIVFSFIIIIKISIEAKGSSFFLKWDLNWNSRAEDGFWTLFLEVIVAGDLSVGKK